MLEEFELQLDSQLRVVHADHMTTGLRAPRRRLFVARSFVAGIPAPLGIGVADAKDITALWRAC